MSSIATVTSKGQVTLPVTVRRALSIEPGDKLSFTIDSDRVVIQPVPDFLSLAGSIDIPPEVRGMPWDQIKQMAHEDRALS